MKTTKKVDCKWRRDMYCAIIKYSGGVFKQRFCNGICPEFENKDKET